MTLQGVPDEVAEGLGQSNETGKADRVRNGIYVASARDDIGVRLLEVFCRGVDETDWTWKNGGIGVPTCFLGGMLLIVFLSTFFYWFCSLYSTLLFLTSVKH